MAIIHFTDFDEYINEKLKLSDCAALSSIWVHSFPVKKNEAIIRQIRKAIPIQQTVNLINSQSAVIAKN